MAIAIKIRTKEDFHNYLDSLGLFRWRISETALGFEAILSTKPEPKIENFTLCSKQKDRTFYVYLAKKDIEIAPAQ